jgi:hypothetical protein
MLLRFTTRPGILFLFSEVVLGPNHDIMIGSGWKAQHLNTNKCWDKG